MFTIRNRKYFYIAGAVAMGLSVLAIIAYGFNLGIDFKGGTIIEVAYPNGRPAPESVKASLDAAYPDSYVLRPTGDNKYSIETKELSPENQAKVLSGLSRNGAEETRIERVNSVGPVIGSELKKKAALALALIIVAIVIFVAFAFRQVSKPVSSWKYGFATIFALVNDVIVPAGVYVVYSKFTGAEIDLLFVTAILAILGYSVNDTIVVFDRVRENLRRNHEHHAREDFETTVGKSLDQTIVRSINTSLTLMLVLVALFVFGGETTRPFIFVLLIGTISGTYSSIFLASPMLVTMEKMQKPQKA